MLTQDDEINKEVMEVRDTVNNYKQTHTSYTRVHHVMLVTRLIVERIMTQILKLRLQKNSPCKITM